MDAYSIPMIPAPTTTIEAGMWSRSRTPSESTMRRSSNSISFGRAGRVPVASTIRSALTLKSSSLRPSVTSMVCGSRKVAVPWKYCT